MSDIKSIQSLAKLLASMPAGRTPQEVRKQAQDYMENKVFPAVIAAEIKSVMHVLPASASDSTNKLENVSKAALERAIISLVIVRGAYKTDRFWIRLDPKKDIFVAFPPILAQGFHNVAATAYAERIGSVIEAGSETSLENFLKSAGVHVKNRRFLFSKGHTLCSTRDDARLAKKDIDAIIASMKAHTGMKDHSFDASVFEFFTV